MTAAAMGRGPLDDAIDHGRGVAAGRSGACGSRSRAGTCRRPPRDRRAQAVDDLHAVAEAPARLHLARLERAVGALDEDALLQPGVDDRVDRDGDRGTGARSRRWTSTNMSGRSSEAGVVGLETDARGLARMDRTAAATARLTVARNRAGRPGTATSAVIPDRTCCASQRRNVGEDPDAPQVGNLKQLLPLGDLFARRQVARDARIPQPARRCGIAGGTTRVRLISSICALRHPERKQPLGGDLEPACRPDPACPRGAASRWRRVDRHQKRLNRGARFGRREAWRAIDRSRPGFRS